MYHHYKIQNTVFLIQCGINYLVSFLKAEIALAEVTCAISAFSSHPFLFKEFEPRGKMCLSILLLGGTSQNLIEDTHTFLSLLSSILNSFFLKDSSHESRPGVERDDTIGPVHQYMCMMLIVYTLYISFTRQQLYLR